MKILFFDSIAANKNYHGLLKKEFNKFLLSGVYVLGDKKNEFENNFAKYLGVNHTIGVSNGLDALTIILKALNIQTHQNVIVPCNTFIATALSVIHSGGKLRLAPVNTDNYLLDCNSLINMIDEHTRAVIAVHLYGKVCNMNFLQQICDDKKVLLIEDAAQAHGAKWNNKYAGTFGDAAFFSFYPTKNLGGFGDGGAIATNNSILADKCFALHNYGSIYKYEHSSIGFNARLDELQAYFLNIKLQKLNDENNRRREIAHRYLEGISNPKIQLPPDDNIYGDAWHLFVIKCEERDRLQKYLSSKGIETLIHYPRLIHEHKAFENIPLQNFGFTFQYQILSIPNGHYLTEDAINYIIDTLNEFV